MQKIIEKHIQDHLEDLETNKEKYLQEYGNGNTDIVFVIDTLDIDSIEFMAGYEQGYLHALKALKREITK